MENFSSLHQVCVQIFESIAKTTSVFVLPLFLMKVVFSNLTAEGHKAFASLKGVIIYFCLILGFPYVLEILFSIPEAYLPKSEVLSDHYMTMSAMTKASMIPYSLDRVLEVLLAGLYWVDYYLHVFFMIVMCSMAPIVFLSSTLLGFGLGLEVFMGLLLAGSSWPIIWYGFDQVHTMLSSSQSDAFGAKCLELLLTFLKGVAPVAFAGLALKSPPGKAVSAMASGAASAASWAHTKGANKAQQLTYAHAPHLFDTQRKVGFFGGRADSYRKMNEKDPYFGYLEKERKHQSPDAQKSMNSKTEDKNENSRSRNS